MANVLYISYDGILEPLGESQVFQYLQVLAGNHSITLLSFEKKKDWESGERRDVLQARMVAAGIVWHPLRYHKAPTVPATLYDVIVGAIISTALAFRYRVDIIHARSYVPALMALVALRVRRAAFIFDMRGFWPDEKVDAGTWQKNTWIFKVTKRLERTALLRADVIISLTHAGVAAIRQFEYMKDSSTPLEVIPTCTNLELFRPTELESSHKPRLRLGYVGNVAGWYEFAPVLHVLRAIRSVEPTAELMIVNDGQHDVIRREMEALGLSDDGIEILPLPFELVPEAMRSMDMTAFFIRPLYSKLASAPTKLGEFLACGVPCLVSDGVGDMSSIIRGEGVGIVVHDMTEASVTDGALKLLQLAKSHDIKRRCTEAAAKFFSLNEGVRSYDAIYDRLAKNP